MKFQNHLNQSYEQYLIKNNRINQRKKEEISIKLAVQLVYVEVKVNPTEDLEKVKRAVENIFGSVEVEVKPRGWGSLLTAKTEGIDGLTKFYNVLRRERIRDAARGVLFDGLGEESIVFYLNKQVAYAGHISFSKPIAESPLGPIKVQIRCDNPRELIEWLAPKTT